MLEQQIESELSVVGKKLIGHVNKERKNKMCKIQRVKGILILANVSFHKG